MPGRWLVSSRPCPTWCGQFGYLARSLYLARKRRGTVQTILACQPEIAMEGRDGVTTQLYCKGVFTQQGVSRKCPCQLRREAADQKEHGRWVVVLAYEWRPDAGEEDEIATTQ